MQVERRRTDFEAPMAGCRTFEAKIARFEDRRRDFDSRTVARRIRECGNQAFFSSDGQIPVSRRSLGTSTGENRAISAQTYGFRAPDGRLSNSGDSGSDGQISAPGRSPVVCSSAKTAQFQHRQTAFGLPTIGCGTLEVENQALSAQMCRFRDLDGQLPSVRR